MNKKNRIWVYLGILVALLFIFSNAGIILLAPPLDPEIENIFEEITTGCQLLPEQEVTTSGDPTGDSVAQGVNACVLRGIAFVNAKIFREINTQAYRLTADVAECAIARNLVDSTGRPIPIGNSFTRTFTELLKCKVKTIKGPKYGGNDETTHTVYSATASPFTFLCPAPGTWITIIIHKGTNGHLLPCRVETCNMGTGRATLHCVDTWYTDSGGGGGEYGRDLNVDGNGNINSGLDSYGLDGSTNLNGAHVDGITTYTP